MKHRTKINIFSVLFILSLSACAQMGFVPDIPSHTSKVADESHHTPMMDTPAQPKQTDLLTTLNETTDSSVTVYPLTGEITDPYTRKNLQPLSSKVLAEGYPVLDPSVVVYPLRPPSSVPPVSFENVDQVGANSSLYSARVQSLASQRDIDDGAFPSFPSSDQIVTDVVSEDIVPMAIKPLDEGDFIDVPDRPFDVSAPPPLAPMPASSPSSLAQPVNVFKKAGTVSRPEGGASTANTAISYDDPWPITRPEKTNMDALKIERTEQETMDMNDGGAIPSLTGY